VNLESHEFWELNSPDKLHAFVTTHPFPSGKRYLLLDEVQLIPGWERAVNSLRLDARNDLFVTGSTMQMLDSKLATLLTGRYVQLMVFPLSFAEYHAFRQTQQAQGLEGSRRLFDEYQRTGGMPGLFGLGDDSALRDEYLDGVLNTIIMKDIVQRNEIRDVDALLKIVRYLMDNIANQITVKGITDYFTSSGRRISADTVDNYLVFLENAYLFYRARREDLKGKSLMKTNGKLFLVDLGFRTASRGRDVSDMGRVLENLVYLELLRRGNRVSVGKHGATEIDFVTFNPQTGTAYYQVATTLLDETVQTRELAPLRKLDDSYPKTVLSLDEVRVDDFDGIRHLNLIDFLLDGTS
jgi:predicted AAA+ superfamily ATPase